ncbi:MAG: sodium:solute symporter family transporter, partial [Flavobacteriales bacterium]
VLNSSVTLFGIDIYKQHINQEAPERTVVKYGKIFGIILALAAMFIAPLIANAGSLFNYLQEINGIYSIPIFTIIVVGYLTKRVPAIAAKIGIFSGSILYIFSQFWLGPNMKESALAAAKASGVTDPAALKLVEADAYPHYLHVMAILFLTNVVIMLIIGYFKPRATPFELEYTKQVDIVPYKHIKLVGITICTIVIGIYIYFAK